MIARAHGFREFVTTNMVLASGGMRAIEALAIRLRY
jgi:hypothetical protein